MTSLVPTDPTFAGLVWPSNGSVAMRRVRQAALVVGGAALLTIAAKVQVPGPIPMTLQTLAVLALGATLGLRAAVLSVLLYLAEGMAGLPVFTNTPPLPAGPAYLVGPTGGFLLGFVVAAALVGAAADRGLMARPVAFAGALLAGTVAIMGCGWAWLALFASVGGMTGLGWSKAFAVGVAPFMLGEAFKVALAAFSLPAIYGLLRRFGAR